MHVMLVLLASLKFNKERVCECAFVSLHCTTTVWSNHSAVFSHMTANIPVWRRAILSSFLMKEVSSIQCINWCWFHGFLKIIHWKTSPFWGSFNLKSTPTCLCGSIWMCWTRVYTLSFWCLNANQQISLFTGLCVASKGSLPPYKPTSVGRTSGYCIPCPHAAYSNLPAFLVKEGGLNSGFMLAHCTAAALGECCISHF